MSLENLREILQDESYGKLLTDPKGCRTIAKKLKAERDNIILKLDTTNVDYTIGKCIQNSNKAVGQFTELRDKIKTIEVDVQKHLHKSESLNQELKSRLNAFQEAQITLQYMKILERLYTFNFELEKHFKKGDDEICVTIFLNISEIQRNLINFNGNYIKNQINDLLNHWQNILTLKLSKDFENILKTLKWPFTSATFSLQGPSKNYIHKLQTIGEYLFQIKMSSENFEDIFVPEVVNGNSISVPIGLLIQPLKKRFLFHFYGNRQTNRSDKPEWYFTQILTWIRDHKELMANWFQPITKKLGYYQINVEVEFMEGLVNLAIEKLKADLPAVQYDDLTFAHTVDEALSFDKELRDTYNYPNEQSGVLSVLTQGAVLMKWIALEKKFATEKMDNILSLSISNPFELLASDIEDLKVTVCADAFITLLKRIAERYESLPQPGHRLLFVDLQLELLDDFRVRLIQLASAEEGDVIESKIPAIANSLHYIENVLSDWGNMLHYLHLYHHKSELEKIELVSDDTIEDLSTINLENKSIFSYTISRYSHMRQDLMNTLLKCVINEVKSKSRSFRRERWADMKNSKDFRSLHVTVSACPMLERIATRLHQLNKYLADKLFEIAWRTIAGSIDDFLFEELVLENRFNDCGALQFKFDITRNLFPIFLLYTEKSANYFPRLNESVIVLNLTKGSALLLRETLKALEGATGVEDTRGRALAEIGVHNLDPHVVIRIINQRTDIETIRRLNLD